MKNNQTQTRIKHVLTKKHRISRLRKRLTEIKKEMKRARGCPMRRWMEWPRWKWNTDWVFGSRLKEKYLVGQNTLGVFLH